MKNAAIRLYVRATTARDETGQGSVEYIGILAIVAVLVGLVAAAISGQSGAITGAVADAIGDIIDG